jgi:hypothetical protein
MVTALFSVVTVTGAAIGAMIYYHSAATTDPLAMVVAQVATGKSGTLLMHEREKIILDNAATQAFTVTSSPKVTSTPASSSSGSGSSGGAPAPPPPPPTSPGTAEAIAQSLLPSYGFASSQWSCLYNLWEAESGWSTTAENASGAYGIPQALPGSKMASAGPNWATDATTQIKWGLGYIQGTYGTPCSAWDHEEAYGWY